MRLMCWASTPSTSTRCVSRIGEAHEHEQLTWLELHNHVRVHDRNRADKALQGHRSAAEESEEDCKGDTESHWAGSDAQRAQAPIGCEEQFADKVHVGVGSCMIWRTCDLYIWV